MSGRGLSVMSECGFSSTSSLAHAVYIELCITAQTTVLSVL